VILATTLGDVLYRFFWAVEQAWMTLIAAGFAWDRINIYLAMVGLGLAAASWLIGYALRYVLTGGDDVMSKLKRDS
jgi:hypothetical protein